MSKRTKDMKKLFLIFGAISLICFIGVALFAVISVFIKTSKPDMTSTGVVEAVSVVADTKVKILSEEFVAKCVGLGITTLILLGFALFMSNKFRTSVWIVSMIISTIIYGEVAMYIIATIWLLDEYCFFLLAKHFKEKLSMNIEIDKREE